MKRLLLGVSTVVLLAGAVLAAHHSYADFEDRNVSVEGTIAKILFANPHVVLTLRTKDAGSYTITWMSGGQLTRMGVPGDLLKVGDVVVVDGSPSRVAPEISKVRSVRRPSDGWRWEIVNGQFTITPAL